MRVYAPAPFRFNGIDYPFGYQEVTDALGDALKAAGQVTNGPAPTGGAGPSAEPADRALTAADDGKLLVCPANRSFTVNAGMPAGYAPGAIGAGVVTWVAGSGVTLTDNRTTGAANPTCSLAQVGKDTYFVVGSKA